VVYACPATHAEDGRVSVSVFYPEILEGGVILYTREELYIYLHIYLSIYILSAYIYIYIYIYIYVMVYICPTAHAADGRVPVPVLYPEVLEGSAILKIYLLLYLSSYPSSICVYICMMVCTARTR